ncbi:hypothetical protein C445_14277 [Halobiforma lacisalsi AJ5]|uniref:Uncharacterized protein n=1 Tax=Natronobacterium lacisalsi AJ5 TaxID=358396 RepID=M0LDI8_NATLA|nr:hypothetical protein C445_14277 [Halobiforma lacisalsi AJ5]
MLIVIEKIDRRHRRNFGLRIACYLTETFVPPSKRARVVKHIEDIIDRIQHVIRVLSVALEAFVRVFEFVHRLLEFYLCFFQFPITLLELICSRLRLGIVNPYSEPCNSAKRRQDRWRCCWRGDSAFRLEMVEKEDDCHCTESNQTPASDIRVELRSDISVREPVATVYETEPGKSNQ